VSTVVRLRASVWRRKGLRIDLAYFKYQKRDLKHQKIGSKSSYMLFRASSLEEEGFENAQLAQGQGWPRPGWCWQGLGETFPPFVMPSAIAITAACRGACMYDAAAGSSELIFKFI
jgi:hypothetical protein